MNHWMRKLHKWVGLLIAIQFLLWMGSGVVMSLLDAAIRSDDRSGIAETFTHFQTLAGDRFYQVDKELKQLCERISPIGRELEAVVQQLH